MNAGLAAVVLLLAVSAYVLLFRDQKSDPSQFRTVPVTRGTVEATVSTTGTVDPATSANAEFGTSGTVEKINVSVGDSVDEGDVLARLDDTAATQALAAAKSKRTAARQALDELDDKDECADGESSSSAELAGGAVDCVTQSQLTSAQADIDAADADVSAAADALDATKLRAPMSGKVVAVNGTVGSSATGSSGGSSDDGSTDGGSAGDGGTGSGSTGSTSNGTLDTDSGLVVIADTDELIVNASFAEADVAKVKKAQSATVSFPALPDEQVTGKVTAIDLAPNGDSDVVRYDARISLPKPPKGLKLGQTAELSVVVDRAKDVLSVPTIAVTGSGDQASVDVVVDGERTTKTVTTGLRGDATTEITSGLEEGDEVVVADASTTSGNGSTGTGGGGPQIERGGGGGGGGGGRGPGGGVVVNP